MNYYYFSCIDHEIRITADSLDEAKDKLQNVLRRGSEEHFNLDDYILIDQIPEYLY